MQKALSSLDVDAAARAIRQQVRDQVEVPRSVAYAKILAVIAAVNGPTGAPDATFTLRLAFGEVKGYEEPGTASAPPAAAPRRTARRSP